MKVLFFESDKEYGAIVAEYLESQNYMVETTSSNEEALEKFRMYEYDCIVLNVPVEALFSMRNLIPELKKHQPTTGMIITSDSSMPMEQRIAFLEQGADDYILKPYYLAEIKARIHSIIRRSVMRSVHQMEVDGITICFDTRTVKVDGNEVSLTPREYTLLVYLITRKDRVMTREMIVEYLLGDEEEMVTSGFDFVYTHIKNLRQKLGKYGRGTCIRTVYGVGYRFAS